ncbi:MAG: 2OG-Fe(II) oxygenase [Moraxellaceae bacterium]|nr:2OG-Fe(II) oxygenase [Moraxellaceae bacterium]
MIPDSSLLLPAFPATDWQPVVDALVAHREVVLHDALPPPCWQALRDEAAQLQAGAAFSAGRIGRAAQTQREEAVRGDALCWLEPHLPVGGAYLAWMEGLRGVLNRELFLGLTEFEAHYAHYPIGSFYKRHVDRHRDSSARVVSVVCYLNEAWPADAGGELVMYGDGRMQDESDGAAPDVHGASVNAHDPGRRDESEDGALGDECGVRTERGDAGERRRTEVARERERYRLRPEGGRLAIFMSEDMPHEVLPATRERWSIAGWFRTRTA